MANKNTPFKRAKSEICFVFSSVRWLVGWWKRKVVNITFMWCEISQWCCLSNDVLFSSEQILNTILLVYLKFKDLTFSIGLCRVLLRLLFIKGISICSFDCETIPQKTGEEISAKHKRPLYTRKEKIITLKWNCRTIHIWKMCITIVSNFIANIS